MKPRIELSDEMKDIATQGCMDGKSLVNYAASLYAFWVDAWRDGCELPERINNAGLNAVYAELTELALLVDKAKRAVREAHAQLWVDAEEVYSTDLSIRVKDMLVDYGCRTRLDILHCNGFELDDMKDFGVAARKEYDAWRDNYSNTQYDTDWEAHKQKRAEVRAALEAK